MAEYLIQSETLDEIADAINAKTGGSSAMTPAEMVTEIGNIQTGGDGSLELLASGQYTLAENSTSGFSIPVSYTGTAKTVFVKVNDITGIGWRTIAWLIETNIDLDNVVTDVLETLGENLYTTVIQNGTTASTRARYTGTYGSSLGADSINCGSGTAYSAKAGTYDWYIWGEAAS